MEPEFEGEGKWNWEMMVVGKRSGGTVKFNQIKYQLKQFHLHSNSENYLQGRQFPLEMHMVHQSGTRDGAKLCVVAIFFKVDDEEDNTEFGKVLKIFENASKGISAKHGDNKDDDGDDDGIDIKSLINGDIEAEKLVSFIGSTTTEPFTPDVQWIVNKNIASVSQKQVDKFRDIMGTRFPSNRCLKEVGYREIIAYGDGDESGSEENGNGSD